MANEKAKPKCEKCGGSGTYPIRPATDGTGNPLTPESTCPDCKGTGIAPDCKQPKAGKFTKTIRSKWQDGFELYEREELEVDIEEACDRHDQQVETIKHLKKEVAAGRTLWGDAQNRCKAQALRGDALQAKNNQQAEQIKGLKSLIEQLVFIIEDRNNNRQLNLDDSEDTTIELAKQALDLLRKPQSILSPPKFYKDKKRPEARELANEGIKDLVRKILKSNDAIIGNLHNKIKQQAEEIKGLKEFMQYVANDCLESHQNYLKKKIEQALKEKDG